MAVVLSLLSFFHITLIITHHHFSESSPLLSTSIYITSLCVFVFQKPTYTRIIIRYQWLQAEPTPLLHPTLLLPTSKLAFFLLSTPPMTILTILSTSPPPRMRPLSLSDAGGYVIKLFPIVIHLKKDYILCSIADRDIYHILTSKRCTCNHNLKTNWQNIYLTYTYILIVPIYCVAIWVYLPLERSYFFFYHP